MIVKTLKNIKKSKITLVSYVLLLVFIISYIFRLIASSGSVRLTGIDVNGKLLGYGKYIFIYFLFVSFYYYQIKIKDKTIQSLKETIVLFWAMVVIEAAVQMLVSITGWIYCGNFQLYSIMAVIKSTLLYTAFPAVLAVMIGLAAGYIRNVIVSALLFVSGYLLFALNALGAVCGIGAIGAASSLLERIARRTYLFYSYYDYYAPVNPYEPFAAGAGAWLGVIGLIIFMYFMILVSRRKIRSAVVVLVLAMICGLFSILPSNEYLVANNDTGVLTNNLDSWARIRTYYENSETQYSDADFQISSYEITIEAGRKTKITADMQMEDTDQMEYEFTLWHDFVITGISYDDGNNAEYSRDGDYFTVKTDTDFNGVLHMEYEGASDIYFSDAYMTDLPDFYPYYPWPGKHKIYDNGFITEERNGSSWFSVKVNSPYDVYSNLESTGENMFEGNAEGVALIGGECAAAVEYKGIKIVYPALLYSEDEIKDDYDKAVRLFENHGVNIKNKNWLVTPYKYDGLSGACLREDYFTGSYREVIYALPISCGFQNWGEVN